MSRRKPLLSMVNEKPKAPAPKLVAKVEAHAAEHRQAKPERKVVTRSRRGHVQLVSGVERGKLTIFCPPELRRKLVVLAAERDLKVSELATELLSEALVARRS